MELVKIKNLSDINRLSGGEFLQSEFWSLLLISEGEILEHWGVQSEGKIIAVATLIRKKILGSFFYYYAPRGPRGEKLAIEFLLQALKNKKTGALFLRIEPEEILEKVGDGYF